MNWVSRRCDVDALVFFPLWNESVKRQHPYALDKYFSNVTM